MKNLLKLSLVSASLSLMAVNTSQASDTQLIGTVAAVCEANVSAALLLDFGINPVAGDMVTDSVDIRCNDADGAEVELRSAEGGLESDDNEDFSVEYTATLNGGPIALSLTTDPGVGTNDQNVTQNIPGSIGLATGFVADLEVTLDDTPFWAGGYSDTLSVEITSN